jgi:hypothetical protein
LLLQHDLGGRSSLASKPREEVFHFDFLLGGLLLDDNRHGCRSSVVTRDGNELKLEVRDQGKGMLSRGNGSQKKLGVDIEGMGERIKQFGGPATVPVSSSSVQTHNPLALRRWRGICRQMSADFS